MFSSRTHVFHLLVCCSVELFGEHRGRKAYAQKAISNMVCKVWNPGHNFFSYASGAPSPCSASRLVDTRCPLHQLPTLSLSTDMPPPHQALILETYRAREGGQTKQHSPPCCYPPPAQAAHHLGHLLLPQNRRTATDTCILFKYLNCMDSFG